MRLVLLVIAISCVWLAGCGPRPSNNRATRPASAPSQAATKAPAPTGAGASGIVGAWTGGGGTLEFTADGHLKIRRPGRVGFTWYKLEGDRVLVGHLMPGTPDEKVRVNVSGNTLTLGSSLSLGTMGTTTFRRMGP